ncbi:hypothetical protein PT974_01879 [Cladobotryum mycophilum]|uniref:Uncharacterized protein n=1 Tax=Cladobotryum mycophilum TaxID=491253 RepID=A0ABR0SWZ9_9HYPO
MASSVIPDPRNPGARAINLEILRTSTLRNQATHLREILSNHPSDTLDVTSQLIKYVASDYLPVVVLSIWLSVCKEPRATVAVLQQQHNVTAQRFAITQLTRHFRNENDFAKAWEAGGAAVGYARVMSNLSVRNLRFLCKKLSSTAKTKAARDERRLAFTELLRLLWKNVEEDGSTGAVIDPRPLKKAYSFIAAACGGKVNQEWCKKVAMNVSYDSDPDFFEKYVLDELLSEGGDLRSCLYIANCLIRDNLTFGVLLFEKWLERKTLGLSPDKFLGELLIPIVKRCSSKRWIGSETHSKLWSIIPQYFQRYPEFKKNSRQSEAHYSSLIYHCTKVWVRSPKSFTETFTGIIGLLHEDPVKKFDLPRLVQVAGPTLRYELLRLFLKHGQGYAFDIGAVDNKAMDCSVMKAQKFVWPVGILHHLPPHEGLCMLEKLREAYPDSLHPNDGSQSLFQKYDPGNEKCSDLEILRALLIRQSENDKIILPTNSEAVLDDLRLKELPRRMRQASQAREPGDRARWAVAAINLSVALGDVDLYTETLLWARRFNKDSRATHVIYNYRFITVEAVELLSGLPLKLGHSTKRPGKEVIEAGNKVLQLLVETTIQVIPNPDFSLHAFSSIFTFIDRVVKSRAERVDKYQDYFKLSDDELFDIVWKPTLNMLIEIETTTLEPANKKLNRGRRGLLDYWKVDIGCQRGPTMKFFDTLAKSRNQIWEKYRISEHPSVATLPEPLSRGLTLEILLHFDTHSPANLPYLHSRAEALVFVSPETALVSSKENDEIKAAVSKYMENWCTALKLYLLQPDSGMNRVDRISRAWKHATGALSKSRMSEEEAVRYWVPVFQLAGVTDRELDSHRTAHEYSAPSIPAVDDVSQPVEWNPDPNFRRELKGKKLAPTYLDAMIAKGLAYSWQASSKTKATIPAVPSSPAFWSPSLSIRRTVTTAKADAYTAAGILAINSKHGADSSLLLQPFPDANARRFPALYLEQEFLERESEGQERNIMDLLGTLDVFTPPRLLAQLASSLLDKIRKETREGHKPFSQFARIIKLLSRSGNPSLASPFIQEFILEQTEASSWHRKVFGVYHLNSLSPSQVQSFLQDFSTAIVKKLELTNERVREAAKVVDNEETKQEKPVVKVSTVKMLAQLVQGAVFISPASSVDVLTGLLERSSNLSICVAVVNALIEAGSTANTNDPKLRRTILDALQRYAGLKASSINESHRTTDWDKAECDGQLPEVWGDNSPPPILKALINIGTQTHKVWPDEENRALAELRCSVLLASGDNNLRWMNLFLKINGFKIPDGYQLPAIPLRREALGEVVSNSCPLVSKKLFERMKQYLLLNLDRPEWLLNINQAIKDDAVLSRSNAGKHWLSLWSIELHSLYHSMGIRWITNALDLDFQNEVYPDNVTHGMLETSMFEIADALLNTCDQYWFLIFIGDVANEKKKSRQESLRTPEWQSNPKRQPAFLPNIFTFKLKLRLPDTLINVPQMSTEVLAKMRDEVLVLLKKILASGLPYVEDFTSLKNHLASKTIAPELAMMLGSIPTQADPDTLTLLDHLLVELAAHLVKKCHILTERTNKFEKETVAQMDDMLEKWQMSRVENFRLVAKEVKKGEILNDDGFGLFD